MRTVLRVFLAFLFSILSMGLIGGIVIGLSLVLLDTDDPGKNGAAAGQYAVSYAFLLVPAIIVACFRSQYLKRKRLYAVVKTFFFLSIVAVIWALLGRNILGQALSAISEENGVIYAGAIGSIIVAALYFASGLLTSKFLPPPDRGDLGPPPLSVRLFGYVFYLLIAVSFAIFVFTYNDLVVVYQQQVQALPELANSFNIPSLIVQSLLTYIVMIFCVVSIMRYGSIMVRNTYAVFMIFSFVVGPITWIFAWDIIEPMIQSFLTPSYIMTMVVTGVLNIIALILIFLPSARHWIKGSTVPSGHSGTVSKNGI
ncbi:MAG: hypothetical protein V7723_15310 [Sneathiella sp.]|uniref:hypothetical protein n=1 Tax=Sneathiella sp. TaxID=1964365 RepID=UPI003002BA3A